MIYQAIDFSRLSRAAAFRRFCRLLCDTTGFSLVFVAPGAVRRDLLYYQGSQAPLCELLRHDRGFLARCQQCDREHCAEAARRRRGYSYPCHAGLVDIVVPVYVGRRHVGTFMGGQLLPEPPTPAGFRKLAARLEGFACDRQRLRDAYFHTTYMPPERLKNLVDLVSLFAEHFRELGSRLVEEPAPATPVARARDFISQHLTEPFTLADVSGAAGLAPAYFSSLFKRDTGEPLVAYVRRLRVDHAKTLLETTAYPVGRIAPEAGFSSLSSFNRCFRLVTGASPRAYRRQAGTD